jgi:hypothetical protein
MRHDLKPRPEATIYFARPINENRRCPQLFIKPLALKSSPTLNLLFPNQRESQKYGEQQQQASRR